MTIVDLRKALAKQTGVEEALAGAFLTQLTAVIKDGLKQDKQVKISGLGTFKLSWVEPRKSVNISTGEPILIDGYQKLSFTPEPSVKERINEPYADLVPVELDSEGNPIEPAEKPKSDRMQRFNEQALEIKSLLGDLNGNIPGTEEETAPRTEELPADEITAYPAEETPQTEEQPAQQEAPVDTELEKAIEAAAATVAAVREIPKQPIEEIESKPEEQPATEEQKTVAPAPEKPAAEEPHEEKKQKPFRPWLVAIITILVLLFLLFLATLFLESKVEAWADQLNGKVNTPEWVEEQEEPEALPADTCLTDSLYADSLGQPMAEAAAPAAEAPAPKVDFYQERNYTDFIGIETVKEGSRLTWIAKRYYGQKDLWVFIYEANRDKIKNPSNVGIGTQLRIPALPDYILDPENAKTQALVKQLQDEYLK